jgi:hypothetical protein
MDPEKRILDTGKGILDPRKRILKVFETATAKEVLHFALAPRPDVEFSRRLEIRRRRIMGAFAEKGEAQVWMESGRAKVGVVQGGGSCTIFLHNGGYCAA